MLLADQGFAACGCCELRGVLKSQPPVLTAAAKLGWLVWVSTLMDAAGCWFAVAHRCFKQLLEWLLQPACTSLRSECFEPVECRPYRTGQCTTYTRKSQIILQPNLCTAPILNSSCGECTRFTIIQKSSAFARPRCALNLETWQPFNKRHFTSRVWNRTKHRHPDWHELA